MFFELHKDSNIGLKALSEADLGIGTSHQTHIGLMEDTFNFIEDYKQYSYAQFIYEDTSKELSSFLDPIQNQDDTRRSPKIRKGTKVELKKSLINKSVVTEIRDIVKSDLTAKWFLMWFGLNNKDLVFFLIKANTKDYKALVHILGDVLPKRKIFKDIDSSKILKYLNKKVNDVNTTYLEELEIAVETCNTNIKSRINPKEIDLYKAQKLLKEIGKQGEELLNQYLNKLKTEKKISDYEWMNVNRETGLPYDFTIIDKSGKLYYSDAKSTSYHFERNMFFSSNELKFINQNRNYLIHRVYDMSNKPLLKITENIAIITDDFIAHYTDCKTNIAKNGLKLNSVKVEVPPTLSILDFKDEPNFII